MEFYENLLDCLIAVQDAKNERRKNGENEIRKLRD